MLTKFRCISSHNYPKNFLVSFIFHNEKNLPDTTNYANNVDQNENNVDQSRCFGPHYENNLDQKYQNSIIMKIILTNFFLSMPFVITKKATCYASIACFSIFIIWVINHYCSLVVKCSRLVIFTHFWSRVWVKGGKTKNKILILLKIPP